MALTFSYSETKMELRILLFVMSTFLWSARGQLINQIDVVVAQDGSGNDVVVAQDGSSNYTNIVDAVFNAPNMSSQLYTIKIKEGTYYENVIVDKTKTNIAFIGDGMEKTVITGNRTKLEGFGIDRSARVGIFGDGFLAMSITFENTGGPNSGQALALRSSANSTFYKCKFLGYQDTLYAHQFYQFYRECHIYGTIDFIFGDATAILQNCYIYVRRRPHGQTYTITAQGRESCEETSGTIFHNCTITAAPDLLPIKSSIRTYLGRPWKNYSRVVVMESYLDNIIDPKGWLQWKGEPDRVKTLYYAEYQNRGPGSSIVDRVQWKGYNLINSSTAVNFTVRNFIQGDQIPAIGVPYIADLLY